jgi:molybdopterin-containing oxidoreductase family iron-sulfur binding subunit
MCMAACPYERRFFTWTQPPVPKEAIFVDYSPEHQIPMKKGVVYKCDFCPEMARAGRLPFCAQACPNSCIYYGDLEEDLATNGEEVVQLSRFISENAAYQYKGELGTRPRVFYIPGSGGEVGRDPFTGGRKPTKWNWKEVAKGAKRWQRSGR